MQRSHARKLRFLLFQKRKPANFRGKTEQITASFRAYHTAIRYLSPRQRLLLGAQKTHAERLIYCNCLTYSYLSKPSFPCDISALRRLRNSTGDSQAHKTAKFSNFEGMKWLRAREQIERCDVCNRAVVQVVMNRKIMCFSVSA